MRVRTGIAAVANFSSNRRSDAPVPSAGDDHGLTLSDAENLQAVARYLADMTSQLESMARSSSPSPDHRSASTSPASKGSAGGSPNRS